MNSKVSRRISRQVTTLLVEWMRSIVPEEDSDKITKENVHSFMPKETHVFFQGTVRLSTYCPKWIRQKIKELIRNNPDTCIEDITMEELECLIKIGSREVSQDHSPSF